MSRTRFASLRSGISLIELLVVLVIISIVLSFAAWKIDVARYQINGDQRSVGSALIATQREAIAKQHNMLAVFDAAHHSMRIVSDTNNNGTAEPGEHVRTIMLGDRVRYGLGTAPAMAWGTSGISFTITEGSSGLPAVIFYRNGSASESRGVYLTSTRAQSDPAYVQDVRAIHVERATGRAEWWHYDGANWVRGF